MKNEQYLKQIRIGALVGMGPNSTCQFYNAVMEYAKVLDNAKFDIDFPEVIMISLPTPFYPDRDINDEDMIARLATGIKTLNTIPVDLIVIPCNIVHKYYSFSFMQTISTIPIINIIEITINEVKNMQPNKIGLIATTPTIKSNLYQKLIKSHELKLFHTTELQHMITELLSELKLFKLSSKATTLWNKIISYLEYNNCTHCVIACTDISVCKDIKNSAASNRVFTITQAAHYIFRAYPFQLTDFVHIYV